MVYAISQERNILIDNEVQRILQASMDKGEIAKMNVKDTSYLLQAFRSRSSDALASQTRSIVKETY